MSNPIVSPFIAYFGYGSLVNLDTLRTPYVSAHRARLKGWQRRWLARPKVENSFAPVDGLAFLSAERCDEVEIDGLVIIDHRASLASLDERETLYDRIPLDHSSIIFMDDNPLAENIEMFIYSAQQQPARGDARIIRSYLDAVLQGYKAHFGEKGVLDFFETTVGFETPIQEDRDAPIYPRSVVLNEEEVRFFKTIR